MRKYFQSPTFIHLVMKLEFNRRVGEGALMEHEQRRVNDTLYADGG